MNPDCLIGILLMVYEIIPIYITVYSTMPDLYPKQLGLA